MSYFPSKGVAWQIGNDDKVLFWTDSWCSKAPLASWCIDGSRIQWDLRVANMIKVGVWDLDRFKTFLLEDVVREVYNIPITNSKIEDRLFWTEAAKADFIKNLLIIGSITMSLIPKFGVRAIFENLKLSLEFSCLVSFLFMIDC